MFKMPELTYREVDKLVHMALDGACWNLSGARDHPEDKSWAEAAEESRIELEAWVNFQRQAFPEYESSCMLDYERHWSPHLPFNRGEDRWEFFAAGNTWTVIKPNGKVIATRLPKDQK
jgi:hypothetical protein